MYEAARHSALTTSEWSPEAARAAITEIVADAVAAFDEEGYWRAHPMDDGMPDGSTGLYLGAAGMVWGLDFLAREGAADHGLDISAILPRLLEANRREFGALARNFRIERHRPSWLFGDPAVLIMMVRSGDTRSADELYRRIEAGLELPSMELMWGFAGTMLACVFASELDGQARWRDLYLAQARRLLTELEESEFGPIWTPDLYGGKRRYLGPVHGYAGNLLALLKGWDWLSEAEQGRIQTAAAATLAANAQRSEAGANWPPVADGDTSRPCLVQYCHGAPGMVAAFADAKIAQPVLLSLLEEGGRLTWRAGPLAKGSNLCHGTGGNGYAFLKLGGLTGDPVWTRWARAFAMTAIDQYRAAKAEYGRGRFTLWTGDLGLAIYLHECLRGSARFPTVDVF
jgi:hypothetical protein